jgi:hypothetical protein
VAGRGERERVTLPPRQESPQPRPCVDYRLSVAEARESHPVFTSSAVVLRTPDPLTGSLPSDHYGVATTLIPLHLPIWRQEQTLVN